jgi:hypothetical protein
MDKSSNDSSNSQSSTGTSNTGSNLYLIATGFILLICFSALTYISPEFSIDKQTIDKPILLLVGILIFAGVIYLAYLFKIPKIDLRKQQLLWVIAIGIVLRVLMLFSTPMLENDFYRYLWDGAVTGNAVNPYKYSPDQVMKGEDVPQELTELAGESGDIIWNINHPHLRTIYPPVAQAFFALSYWVDSWSLNTWRIILIIMDLATLSLIFNALGILKLPSSFLIIYWWNPLLIKEIFNSGHLDILIYPFVLSALILASQSKYVRSTFSLIIAIGIKLWPVFILPLIIRPVLSKPKQLFSLIALAAVTLGVIFIPMYMAGLDNSSGLIAYGQNNDSAFKLLTYVSKFFLEVLGFETLHKSYMTRFIVMALTGIWILYITFSNKYKNTDLFTKSLFIVAFAFLISPTQFPWYYTWLLPLLAINPRFSLLLLTALLPMYYLRFYFRPRDQFDLFVNVIVWIEFIPVWALILWEWRKGKILNVRSS